MHNQQDKQKVTLYLPSDLHRQLKIRAAVDAEAMSAIAEQALSFYLAHADIVAEVEASVNGSTHQVHNCPECGTSVVLRSGEMVALKNQISILNDDGLKVQPAAEELITAGV
jgi:plasmid stability protein